MKMMTHRRGQVNPQNDGEGGPSRLPYTKSREQVIQIVTDKKNLWDDKTDRIPNVLKHGRFIESGWIW